MISLLVVSDTHGQKYILEEVLKRQLQIDDKFRPRHLVHLGDGIEDLEGSAYCDRMCIHSVRGNCDSIFYSMTNAVPKEKVIEIMGSPHLVQRCRITNPALASGFAEMGSICPPHPLARSPGLISTCKLQRQ